MTNNRNDQSGTTGTSVSGNNEGGTPSSSNPGKYIPKDGQVIMAIMKEVGLQEHDIRTLHQLLEFVYKHTTTVLDDSRMFANHAKKKNIEIDDVKLAIEMQNDRIFTLPPPRDLLLDLARMKNNIPLQTIKVQSGIRLPPDRYCLLQNNYRLKYSATRNPKKNTVAKQFPSGIIKENRYISSNIKSTALPVQDTPTFEFKCPESYPSQEMKTSPTVFDLDNITETSDIKDEKEILDNIMDVDEF